MIWRNFFSVRDIFTFFPHCLFDLQNRSLVKKLIWRNFCKKLWGKNYQISTLWHTSTLVFIDLNQIVLPNSFRLMMPRKDGLIVNVSSAGGLKYLFNVCYGVGKVSSQNHQKISSKCSVLSEDIYFTCWRHKYLH